MELSRYTQLRQELIEGHDKIVHRRYEVWIAPSSLMTVDQVRERDTLVFEGAEPDTEFFSKQAKRSMTMLQIVRNLNNFTTFNDLGFQRPNTDVVDMYETLQGYILNWCTIIRNVPEYGVVNLNELKQLENLAYVLFERYKVIKPYTVGYKQRQENLLDKDKDQSVKDGLVGLAMLLSRQSLLNPQSKFRNEDDSFVSHIDELKQWANGTSESIMQPPKPPQPSYIPIEQEDSIAALSTSNDGGGLMDWYRNRG